MMQKNVWKALLSNPHHITTMGILLAHENELLTLTYMSSVLEVSKPYISNILRDILKILTKNKIQFTYQTSNKGIIFSMPKVIQVEPQEEVKVLDNVDIIIGYLNERTNKNYTTKNKATIKDIQARIKEGYVFDDFKYVVDIKASQWMNTEMEQYLRPQTLFGNKFNSYINERPITNGKQISKIESAINQTTRAVDWGLD
jgi:uncharacterized phage protein (TIGR02220 family)